MINLNDIMIGDWVYKHAAIKGLGRYEQITYQDLLDDKEYLVFREYDPVPITPEILEKNGWILDEIDGSYRHKENGFWIGGRNAPFGFMISNVHREIKYVHELQHALKLAEIELKIII